MIDSEASVFVGTQALFCCYGFPRWGKLSAQPTDEGAICDCCKTPRRGEVTPPYGAIKTLRSRGGALPRPQPYIIMNIMGWFVGAAYMPPVAAAPTNRPNGQTARDAYMRPLQTCRKYRIITEFCNNKNVPARRAHHISTLNSTLLTLN